MSKFQALYNTLNTQLEVVSEAGLPPADPSQAAAGPDSTQPQTPAPQEVKPPQQTLTSEGKKFLIELALRALAVGPENLTASDKAIFSTEITQENADEMLKRIQTIVDLYG